MTTLVLGPSLGTRATTLWGPVVDRLGRAVDVRSWELPGHTPDAPVGPAGLTIDGLAEAVLEAVEGPFHYAGDSVGGAVGLQLALAAPDRVQSLTVLCSGAKILDEATWLQRAELVRREGMAAVVEGSRARWFGTGFEDRDPDLAGRLLRELAEVDPEGYAAVCGALATYDVRSRLGEITTPLTAVAGLEDEVTSPTSALEITDGVSGPATLVTLGETRHLAPAERPDVVAELIKECLS